MIVANNILVKSNLQWQVTLLVKSLVGIYAIELVSHINLMLQQLIELDN